MRVLVLHQHYRPEIAATAQILSDICEDLAARGHEVVVVCGQPSYHRSDQGTSMPAAEVLRGVGVRRLPVYVPAERTVSARLMQYSTYFASATLWAVCERRPDVCLVMSSPPLLLGLSGTLLKLLRGVPFVYSVQDLYPDVALELGVIRPGPISRLIDLIASSLYRQAACVVTLSDAMARGLIGKGVAPACIEVVPNWSDTEAIRSLDRENSLSAELGLDGRFVVQYAGNLGLTQGLEHVVDAFALLRDEPVTLALIGQGNAKPSLQRQVRELGLKNVVFHPPQPRERLGELLAAADVGLVTMKRTVGNNLVPSKLYGIMAASRPVLAAVARDSEVARTVSRFDCGIVVEPEDPRALASGIRTLMRSSRLKELGRNGRQAGQKHFSRRVCTERYAKVLEGVVHGRVVGPERSEHAELSR